MSRPAEKQLQTAYWLLAQFNNQLAESDTKLPHRIDALREGKATTEQRIRDLGGTVPE